MLFITWLPAFFASIIVGLLCKLFQTEEILKQISQLLWILLSNPIVSRLRIHWLEKGFILSIEIWYFTSIQLNHWYLLIGYFLLSSRLVVLFSFLLNLLLILLFFYVYLVCSKNIKHLYLLRRLGFLRYNR